MPHTDGPELFRVQPDTPPAPPSDIGIHSWPFGSYAPMAFYRPTPIVHFTGTVVVQFLLLVVLHIWLAGTPGVFSIGAFALVTLILARRAFVRWLWKASTAWKVATFAALALNLLFVSFIVLARGCGPSRLASGLEQAVAFRTAASEGCQPSVAEMALLYAESLP